MSQCLMVIIARRSGQIDVELITISAVLGLPVHCPSPFKTLPVNSSHWEAQEIGASHQLTGR